MSLNIMMPAPVHSYEVFSDAKKQQRKIVRKKIPPYGQRQSFEPVKPEDFGDGGAFPEIHIRQFPLNMGGSAKTGLSDTVNGSGGCGVGGAAAGTLAIRMDGDGSVSYDAIAQRGKGDQKIYSKFTDLIERDATSLDLQRPDDDTVAETAAKTAEILMGIVDKKVAANRTTRAVTDQSANAAGNASFIKYTPRPGTVGYSTDKRIIRMVTAQVDPMEPPKFKHKKVPRGPGSPPVPIMHSPPRKVTAEDQESWKIPPCISNWKNARGYTIPLDKRLAADGRGLTEVTINSKFAKLSESLYIAERKARKEVEIRAQMRQNVAMKEKVDKEEELRQLAAAARSKISNAQQEAPVENNVPSVTETHIDGNGNEGSSSDDDLLEDALRENTVNKEGENVAGETREELEARKQRENLRKERKRERMRDIRLEARGGSKKSKTSRDMDRDISERVALGMPVGNAQREAQFDTRLFNQSEGLSSGFGPDDEYNTYTTELFNRGKQKLYTGKKVDSDTYGTADEQYSKIINSNRFKPDKDFEGVDRNGKQRDGPVQFERRVEEDDVANDPFGLDSFFMEAKKGSEQKNPLDHIGKRGGGMAAAVGGGLSGGMNEEHQRPSRSKIEFQESQATTKTVTNSSRQSEKNHQSGGRSHRRDRRSRSRDRSRRDRRRSRSRDRSRRERRRSRSRDRSSRRRH